MIPVNLASCTQRGSVLCLRALVLLRTSPHLVDRLSMLDPTVSQQYDSCSLSHLSCIVPLPINDDHERCGAAGFPRTPTRRTNSCCLVVVSSERILQFEQT